MIVSMSEAVSTYRVFVANPGGLEAERRAFREALREWNEMFSLDRGIAFYPIGWEDTLPGKGRPQSLINDDVRKCDFLLLLLWDRWGTPPGGDGSYTSGTEEEFNIANECIDDASMPMRQIVVLFKSVEVRQLSDPGEQFKKVLDFKRRLEEEKLFLFGTFDTTDEFAKLLQRQLWAWFSDLDQNGDGKPARPVGGPIPPATPVEPGSTPQDSGDGERAASPLIEQAERLANEGRLADAEAKFATAILKQPAAEDLLSYGEFLMRVGRLEQAQVLFSEAQRIAIATHDEQALASAYSNLGNLLQIRGELDGPKGAEAIYNKALEINEKLGLLEGMAVQYGKLGLVMQTRGELDGPEGAEAMHGKALEINEKLGLLQGMANQYGNLGLVKQIRGELEGAEGAEAMHRKSLEINEKLRSLEGMARQYGNLGIVKHIRGELDGPEGAEAMYRKSLKINEELGLLKDMANQYGNLGIVRLDRGDLDGAEAMYRKSLEIDEKLGRIEGMAKQYGNLGGVMQRRGSLHEASQIWTKSRDLFAKLGAQHMVDKVQGWINELPKGSVATFTPTPVSADMRSLTSRHPSASWSSSSVTSSSPYFNLRGLSGMTFNKSPLQPLSCHLLISVHLWLLALCVLCDSAVNPISGDTSARVRRRESHSSARNFQKISSLARRQAVFGVPICQKFLPGARPDRRRTLYERSCRSMLASSRRSKQKFRGRGHAGAHKLIPMPTKTSCAPGRPPLICVRQSTIGRTVVLVFPGGRGHAGAHKLIPMPTKISCAQNEKTADMPRWNRDGYQILP